MRIARPPRKSHPETIVALIDVVFFLLVFFMLIGRMDATAPFSVTPPSGTTGADMPSGGMTLSVAPDGTLALDGTESTLDAALTQISDRLATEPDLLIRVNADQATELRHVLPLVGRIETLGARDVVLVVTPNPA